MWNFLVRFREQARSNLRRLACRLIGHPPRTRRTCYALLQNDRVFVYCMESVKDFDGDDVWHNSLAWKFELVGTEKLYQQVILRELNRK